MDKVEVKLKCYELATTRANDPDEILARAKAIHKWVSEAEAASEEKSYKGPTPSKPGKPAGQAG